MKRSILGRWACSPGRSARPRSARVSAGGYCYHVINRGLATAEVFHKDEDLGAFVRIMGEACIQGHRIKMGVFHKIGKSRHSD